MNYKRISFFILHSSFFILILSSCHRNNPDSAGVEYMPDMYRSPSYEDNSSNPLFSDGMTDRMPVAGTVPLGFTPFPFPNTPEGLENASTFWKDPYPATPEVVAQGKAIYEIYCIHCHGTTGMGDGKVGLLLHPPAYSKVGYNDYPEGEIFYIMEYGKNMMGSHAGQLSVDQRCKIVRYVQTLQKIGQSDTVKTASANKDTTKKGS